MLYENVHEQFCQKELVYFENVVYRHYFIVTLFSRSVAIHIQRSTAQHIKPIHDRETNTYTSKSYHSDTETKSNSSNTKYLCFKERMR